VSLRYPHRELDGDKLDALEGSYGDPSDVNRYVTESDSRNTDDRTASGLRTASGIVGVSGASAPSVGQALVATGPSSAVWLDISSSSSTMIGDRFDLYSSTFSTTSTTPQLYRTWVTPSLEPATYIVKWSWKFGGQYYSTPGRYRVNLNNTNANTGIVLDYTMAPAYNDAEQLAAYGVNTITVTVTGTQTFRVFLNRVGTTSRTVYIFSSYLELVKVVAP